MISYLYLNDLHGFSMKWLIYNSLTRSLTHTHTPVWTPILASFLLLYAINPCNFYLDLSDASDVINLRGIWLCGLLGSREDW